MIKSFFRQVAIHFDWFMDNPLGIFRIIKSFCCYLWNDYSDYDLMDTDDYILQKIDAIMPAFIKHETGHPSTFKSDEDWKKELNFFRRNVHTYLTHDLYYKLEERTKQEISEFLRKYLWHLWY